MDGKLLDLHGFLRYLDFPGILSNYGGYVKGKYNMLYEIEEKISIYSAKCIKK
jgi:hypothetical protein